MKDYEKAIEEASIKCVNESAAMKSSPFSCFIAGAKSPEAKEYWQQEMYSEEEVLAILEKFVNEKTNNLRMSVMMQWFSENKKK